MLSIVKSIKEIGLNNTLEKFKLKHRMYDHKVLIKYDQIESDMSLTEVQEARGLILEKDTWRVMSMSFYKFFNSAESNAAKIDWDSALILDKLDGSLISVYWDWVLEKWCVATTGTAEAEGEVNNKLGTTFADLFWNTVNKNYYSDYFDTFEESLKKGRTYMFELCTPYNIVVKPHSTSSVTLLAVRDLSNLSEFSYDMLNLIAKDIGVPLVNTIDINAKNSGHVISTLEGMPFTEEGYVVVDKNFNRIKIKNPAYVSAHHLKSKTAEYKIITIIKENEIEEFSAVFPERYEELLNLKKSYTGLEELLNIVWEELKQYLPKNITKEEQKKFATKVFEISDKYDVRSHTGLFFGLKNGKVKYVKEYLKNMDEKKLYNIL